MPVYDFETVDVFTDTRFGGNPLAVFPDARGLSAERMQALAAEFNLSETAFVLPPADPANTVRVRIFNRSAEMAFAGHPSIGTAFVLARRGVVSGDRMTLEVPAGPVEVTLHRAAGGDISGGTIEAPQPLTLGANIPPAAIAACLSLSPSDILVGNHGPVVATMGNPYVIAEVSPDALARCEPDRNAFRRALDEYGEPGGRFSLHVYCREGDQVRARMFAPLAGTWEDPATGSANTPLVGLLLSLGEDRLRLTVSQGVELGRPSVLSVEAWRAADGIRAAVAGQCVPMFTGSYACRDE